VEDLAEKEALRKAKLGSKRQEGKKRKSSSSSGGDDFQDLTLLLSKLSAPDTGANVVRGPLNTDGSALAEITLTSKQKLALKAQVSSFFAICGSSYFVQVVYWPVATPATLSWWAARIVCCVDFAGALMQLQLDVSTCSRMSLLAFLLQL
jgi:hypothetical protein